MNESVRGASGGEMTTRERFCRVVDFESVDRPPRLEAIAFWGETLDAWRAEGGIPADVDPYEHFGVEPWSFVSGGVGGTSMALAGPPVESHLIEENDHTQVWENDLGMVWRSRSDGHDSMPHWLKFPVECHQDWVDKIKWRLDPATHDYGDFEEQAAKWMGTGRPVGFFALGLYAFWRNFWGMENLAYAFFESPDTLHDMAATWLRMHCECDPHVLERIDADYVMFHEDMAFKNGPLIGPDLFDAFMAPYYRELLEHLRNHGQHRLMVDSDGQNGPILERFIDLGIGGLFPFEVAAGYDIREFRKTHPDFFIWGGLDKRVLLEGKDAIRREVLEKVPVVWETGGYIPSLDHAVPPCPLDNFAFFLETVRGVFAA